MKTLTNLVASILLLGASTSTAFCSISAVATVTQPSCANSNDGSASVTPVGGTPQYSYLWTNGQTTSSLQNIGAGTYYVTITDALNNTLVKEVIVPAPSPITITGVVTNESVTHGLGSANGAIDITVTGGTPEYYSYWTTYDGSGVVMGSLDQNNLTSGTYTFTIVDAYQCTSTAMFGVGTINVAAPSFQTLVNYSINGSTSTSNIGEVYPNPSHGDVNIRSIGETQSVEIYNSNGVLVEKIDQMENAEQIHSLELKAGDYTVNFIQKDGTRNSEKLIVR